MICDDIWVWDGVGENVEAKRTQTLVICIADPTKRQSKHNFIYFFIYFDWIFIYFLGIDWIFQPNYGKSPFFMGKSTIEMVIFQAFHIQNWGDCHPSTLRKVIRILVSSGGPALLGDPFSRTEWVFAKR